MRQLMPLVLLVALGCGSSGGGGGNDGTTDLEGLVSLEVTPADQTLVIAQSQPATSAYTVTGTFDDGRVEDITDLVQLSLADATLGSFSAADLITTAQKGGQTEVLATAAGV